MVIAGEVSGDMHAAGLVRAIRKRIPASTFFGTGGSTMRGEGVEILEDISEMAVMGFSEVARRYLFFRKLFNRLLAEAEIRKPDAVILVDYPGFNLRIAKRLHAAGIKTIYYICPQVWAWNRGRIPKMAASLDRLLTIFPFENSHFEGTGLKTDFVGHPLVEETAKARNAPPASLPWSSDVRVALLPGSRMHEIDRLLPLTIQTAAAIKASRPEASFIIAASSASTADYISTKLTSLKPQFAVEVVPGQTRQILRQAKAAIVASGTATVETALMECPMVIVYKVSLLTYLIGRALIRIDNIGMVNIIAGRTICPEFIQSEARPDRIAAALLPLLDDTPERQAMVRGLIDVRNALGTGNVEESAAAAVCEELSRAKPR
jgi:lipid-A-disaccharide synthase